MPTAIVTGATGILGRQIVSAMAKEPCTWTTVHALSRSQKGTYSDNVKHDTIDLSGDSQQMAKQLKDVSAEYVFFAAYLQKDTDEENWDINGAMLQNFLEALVQNGAIDKIKRFVLVCGAKQYGVHLGRVKNPMEESDPRIDQQGRPPNFYYNQQDILFVHSKKHGYKWNVTYANDVIGFAKNNFMNLAISLGIYAAISKEIDGKLRWPGSDGFYSMATSFTSSKLHAEFCLWAALEPKASNQAFNVTNGDTPCYEALWPKIAAYFGCSIPADQFSQPPAKEFASKSKISDKPPIAESAKELGLQGASALQPSELQARIDVTKWSQQDKVKEAWDSLAEKHNLEKSGLERATWGFLMFVLGRDYQLMISMSKAREMGWTGYVDTWTALRDAFDEYENAKMLPPKAS